MWYSKGAWRKIRLIRKLTIPPNVGCFFSSNTIKTNSWSLATVNMTVGFMKTQHADLSLRCLALTWVIWPLEKSNTSSLSSLRMTMLFWQRLSLVRLAPTMSVMKVGQCLGHSCFRICRHISALHGSKRTVSTDDDMWKWKTEGMNLWFKPGPISAL